jgi:hypothetical protein
MNSARTSRATAGQETSAMARMIERIDGRAITTTDDHEYEGWDGLERLGGAHEDVVHQPAVVAGRALRPAHPR